MDPAPPPATHQAVKLVASIPAWLLELFNPPLRDSLTIRQKIGRVLFMTMTLVTLSIIVALVLTLLLFGYESGGKLLDNTPHLASALKILGISVVVNAVCIKVLFQLKRLDERLMASGKPPEPSRPE
jgi:hypothetical protein